MIFTIDSDDEVPLEIDEEEEKKLEIIPATKTKKSKGGKKKEEPAFHFEFDAGDVRGIAPLPSRKRKTQDTTSDQSDDDESDIDEDRVKVIDKKAPKLRKQDKNSKMEEEIDAEEDFGMDDDDEKEFFDEVIDTTSKGKKLSNNNGNQYESDIIFAQLNLSRPFLRAIEAMGYTTPTPIQTQVIPHALAGRDICASAVTGSGKTAAFLLPALERLLYRPKDIPAIRVLVITPTRELATQIYDVLQKLSQFTDITSLLICGGNKDVRSQEAQLKQEPDIVICTPGRMLDHLRNSLSITLDYLNILILDEVDRLLELGFQEEVEELIKYCPFQRQTMLFSATMTPKIEDLIKLSLKKPLRIKTDSSKITIASRLIQEFIKLKNISESLTAMNNSTPARKNFFEQQKEKEAILLALIHRSFHTRTIVFFELKKNAQRFCALLNLSGIKAVELHGDLPQIQRYMSLESFRTGEVEVLVATDVAARGIDISQVQTVINAEMPRNISIYIHRVGRTARAGCGGRSITLVSEDRRKIMKEVLKEEAKKIAAQRLAAEEEEQKNGNKTNKNNKNEKEEKKKKEEAKKQKKSEDNDDDDNEEDEDDEEEEEEEKDQWDDDDDKEKKNGFSTNQILSRNVPSNVVQHYLDKINNLEPSLANYLQEERHRRQIDQLEREAERAQNILLHQDEIQSRPARTWFQTETQKQQLRTLSKERIRSEREALSNPRKRTLSQGEEGDEGDNDSGDDDEEEDDMMLESERKLKELSTADDYRIDENDKSNKKLLQHRLSRKKRRRLEALEASREADEEGDEGQSNRKSTPAASVKQVKQQQREKQREKLGVAGKTAGELTMKKVTVVEAPVKRVNDGEDDDGEYLNRAKGKKRTKVVRQTFAYGGLDQDIYESSTSSRLSKKKAVKNEAEDWKEFDPTKRLKKGGKAGTASFKSKKKYKRRK